MTYKIALANIRSKKMLDKICIQSTVVNPDHLVPSTRCQISEIVGLHLRIRPFREIKMNWYKSVLWIFRSGDEISGFKQGQIN